MRVYPTNLWKRVYFLYMQKAYIIVRNEFGQKNTKGN